MKKKVHLIGNAHIDPVWLWRKVDGYTEVLSTFRSALDRMNENENYIFTCSAAAYYTWVEKMDPAMFEEIRTRIKEGRWVIAGGWWIQPDCNAPCGESFARHALYSQSYFEDKFGVKAKVGYNVDSFGHNAMLPQILRQSGMSGYVYMRPDDKKEKQYPFKENVFIWESPDGSQIPTFRIPDMYTSSPFEAVAEEAGRVRTLADELGIPEMSFYGVGNHGGGPTKQNLKALEAMLKEKPDAGYGYSSPNEYFEELPLDHLPVLKDDLQHHASGCYTAVMKIKELNRMAEMRLMAAEKYWSMARLLGLTTEKPDFTKAWKTILFNQFHDIMGSCCVKSGLLQAQVEQSGALAEALELGNEAIQMIAWNVGTLDNIEASGCKYTARFWGEPETGAPAIIFNPHSWDVETAVYIPCDAEAVSDQNGKFIPLQRVRAEYADEGYKYGCMIYAKIPAMGWSTYRAYRRSDIKVEVEKTLWVSEYSLENEWTKVCMDPETGAIISIFDKKENRELLKASACSRVVDEEKADTWAHGIFTFHDYVGNFGNPKFRIVEDGPIRAILEVCTEYNHSKIRQKFTMYREKPGVFIDYKVVWLEEHKMLKLSFPTTMEEAVPVSSIPYGFMERRADGKDYPMQKWIALMENASGFGIATDTRTAYDAENGTLCITALRSPLFADHYGHRDEECEFSEQGEHEFKLYVNSVKGSTLELHQTSEVLALPMAVIFGSDHKGSLQRTNSLAQADQPNVEITVVKFAEKNEGLIVRCHETEGKHVNAKIQIGQTSFDAAFTPQQIRTFRVNGEVVTDTDMLESM